MRAVDLAFLILVLTLATVTGTLRGVDRSDAGAPLASATPHDTSLALEERR
jgi:hypothetical protein